MKNIENLHAPLCQDETHLNQEISNQLPYMISTHTKWSQVSDLSWHDNALAETCTSQSTHHLVLL